MLDWLVGIFVTLIVGLAAMLGIFKLGERRPVPAIKPLSPEALERVRRRRLAEEAAEDAALAAILQDAEKFDPNDGRFDEHTKRLAARAVRRQNRLD